MGWITENIISVITDFVSSTLDYFGEVINNIYFGMVGYVLNNEYVINAEKFITVTALALIVLMVMKIVVSGYLLETDYDPEADPFQLLIKIAQTVAVIINSNWIFNWLFKAGKDFTSDLIGIAGTAGYAGKTRELLKTPVSETLFCYILMIFIILISVMVFTVVAGLRAGELIAMKLLFPYFALDLLTNSRERWNNFFMAYLIAFFSYAFQMLFYMIAMKSYIEVSAGNPYYSISTLVFMILAIKAPAFLEKFIYKSGFSGAASGGLRMVAQTAIMKRTFR